MGSYQFRLRQQHQRTVSPEIYNIDGWETCRLIREVSDVPVIMLTGRDDEMDKARGLDLGAGDYLTKPFGFVELQARIRADMPATTQRSRRQLVYHIGALIVEVPAHIITRHGKPVALTPTEFRLLEHLLSHAGLVLSHHQLLSGRDLYSHSTVARSQGAPPVKDILYQALTQIHQMRSVHLKRCIPSPFLVRTIFISNTYAR